MAACRSEQHTQIQIGQTQQGVLKQIQEERDGKTKIPFFLPRCVYLYILLRTLRDSKSLCLIKIIFGWPGKQLELGFINLPLCWILDFRSKDQQPIDVKLQFIIVIIYFEKIQRVGSRNSSEKDGYQLSQSATSTRGEI